MRATEDIPQGSGAGNVSATQAGGVFRMQDCTIGVTWSVTPDGVGRLTVINRIDGTEVPVADPFSLLLKDGTIYRVGNFIPVSTMAEHQLTPRLDAARAADRLSGELLNLPFESADHALKVDWSLVLLEGSSYVRQLLTITAVGRDVLLSRVELIDLPMKGAYVSGSVQGSPIIAGNLFLGFEHPMSKSKVTNDRATAWVNRDLPLRAGQSITYSSVIGVARSGQMRRDFLAYLEQERAHPTALFCITTRGMTSATSRRMTRRARWSA